MWGGGLWAGGWGQGIRGERRCGVGVGGMYAAVAEGVKAGRWEAGKSTDRLRWVRTGSGSDYRAIVKRLIVKRLQSDCKAM